MTRGPRIYNLFPLLAGTVRQWTEHLPRIRAMGFDWVFLNPFHYPGFSGSLYAVKDYYRLHPFFHGDDSRGADALLREFVCEADRLGLRVMMDLVVNHTAKDSLLAAEHPEWFSRDASGEVRSPFAIDPADARKVTVWGDLAELDYAPRVERLQLVAYWKDLLRHFTQLGFRGFRCDAAYKIPSEVWRELTGMRAELGDILFVAETLGCRLEQMQQLRGAGFDFFFNSSKWWDFRAPWLLEQYEAFRHIAPSIAFPESHDTPRFATELEAQGVREPQAVRSAYAFRYLFATFFSAGLLMPMGFEHGAKKRLDVVRTRPDDTEPAAFDLAPFITRAHEMKASIPALNEEGPQWHLPVGDLPGIACLLRLDEARTSGAIALVHLGSGGPIGIRAAILRSIPQLQQTGLLRLTDVTPEQETGPLGPDSEVAVEPRHLRVVRADAG